MRHISGRDVAAFFLGGVFWVGVFSYIGTRIPAPEPTWTFPNGDE